MEDGGLNKYLDEIGHTSLLTNEEECELSRRIKQGDERALARLVEANLKFVVVIARQYKGNGLAMEDLVSEGNIGLMKAASKFDGEKGVRFVSFAAGHVRRQIEKAIDQQAGLYKVPKDAVDDMSASRQNKALSVDAPIGHRTNMSLLSVLVNADAPLADERVHSEAIEEAIERALESLDERESRVVNAFFGITQEHETMAEIAEDMDLKRERVRQIRDKAIRKLRKAYKQALKNVFLLVAMLMLGCGGKTGQAAGNADSLAVDSVAEAVLDKHSEAYISQRIDTIYKTVAKTVIGEGKAVDYIHNPFNRDSAYCSERYYALKREALQMCDEMGDILYDYDYWVCGQDFSDDWSYKVANVYNITDSTAMVDLMIHNFSDTGTTIALRFERDDWYIDDFSPSEDGYDDKEYLRDTIERGLEAREKAKACVGYWGWVGDDCPELLLRLEMTDKGLEVTECNIYRMYGFDQATATFNGTDVCVEQIDYNEDDYTIKQEFHYCARLNDRGELIGDCRLRHPLASKNYDGTLILRKDYFKYDD